MSVFTNFASPCNFWTNVSVNSELIRLLQVSRSQLFVVNLMRSNHVSYTQPHTPSSTLSLSFSRSSTLLSLSLWCTSPYSLVLRWRDTQLIYSSQCNVRESFTVYYLSLFKCQNVFILHYNNYFISLCSFYPKWLANDEHRMQFIIRANNICNMYTMSSFKYCLNKLEQKWNAERKRDKTVCCYFCG